MSTLVNRNVIALRGRTSIRLEPEFWQALEEVAKGEGNKLNELVRRIEQQAVDLDQGLTSSVRVYLLRWYRNRAQIAAAMPGRASS